MKVFAIARLLALLLIGVSLACVHGNAQNLVLSVKASTNSIAINNPITYTINLSNGTASALQDVFVTNSPSASVSGSALTNSQGTVSTNFSDIVFNLGTLSNAASAQMSLTFTPTDTGPFTNTITAGSSSLTNILTTNVVTQVTAPRADLAIGITGPSSVVYPGDQFVCGVIVSNRGASTATNVIVSNTLPAGIGFLGLSPTNQAFTLTNNSIRLSLGELTNAASRSFDFRVQSTNAGAFGFSASVSSSTPDPNAANNTAGTNIVVSDFIGQLIATNASMMTYNPQTGLMEQIVSLANIGTNSVDSARVIVSGLTNPLYNAVGTNNGNPFVVYGARLDPGQSTNLLLEYFVPTRLPITVDNSNYTAVGIDMVNLTPVNGTNGSFSITSAVPLTNGNFLIEFQAVAGRSYTILYSGSMTFESSNTFQAQPPIVALADRVQWVDDGPPKTISVPASTNSRFYRVLLNP